MKRREMLIGVAVTGAAGIATIAAVTQSAQALAQAVAPPASGATLDRIIKEKKLRVTAEVTSPPFGILDRNNQPDGSEIETARQLAKDLGVELELVQVTGPQRIPALLAGRADVAISSLSITFDRAKCGDGILTAGKIGLGLDQMMERTAQASTNGSEKNLNCLRPACFALYMATSAFLSNSAGSIPSSG